MQYLPAVYQNTTLLQKPFETEWLGESGGTEFGVVRDSGGLELLVQAPDRPDHHVFNRAQPILNRLPNRLLHSEHNQAVPAEQPLPHFHHIL